MLAIGHFPWNFSTKVLTVQKRLLVCLARSLLFSGRAGICEPQPFVTSWRRVLQIRP